MRNRYIKTGFSIEVRILNGYIVRANINKVGDKNSKTYDVTLELRQDTVGKWDMLNEAHYSITSNNINSTVCDLVDAKNSEGFFNKYIERYQYEIKCFEMGDLIENSSKVGGN